MAQTMHFELVTPASKLLDLDVEQVGMTGIEGDFGVLPEHTPFLTVLQPGELTYLAEGTKHHVFVDWGFCEVLPDRISVMAEMSELAVDIDYDEARERKESVEQQMREAGRDDERDFSKLELELIRQIARMRVAKTG